uniref:RRM domain-containing protein n=1 Tax=Oryza brachyantha TaxID=4533 RepID=J3MSD7_ORYBR
MDLAAGCAFLKYGTKEQALAAIEALKGKHNIEMFQNVRSRCYRLNMSDQQLAELAFQGLLDQIREKFSA